MAGEHVLERRSRLLAQAMTRTSEGMAQLMQGPGGRPPFTEHMTSNASMDWWATHRTDKYGQAVIESWMANDPAQGMVTLQELDAALARRVEAQQTGGL